MKLCSVVLAAAALSVGLLSPAVTAQQFPTKPVKIVTPFPAGAGVDVVLRLVADKLSRAWGHQVLVENRPGGNGFIAAEAAKRSAPDGYTILNLDNFQLSAYPHLYKQLPYDPVRDFEPITPLIQTHFFIVVPANSKWKNIPDLVAAAKAKPGALAYGSWGIGSPGHLGAALLEGATGTQMTHVPYKEMLQLYTGVGNGELDWAFGSAGSAGPSYRSGKVKFLALAAPRRLSVYPDVPTVAEAGGPANFEVGGWMGLLAPRGTPVPIISRIGQDAAKAMLEPDIRERLVTFGYEPYTTSPGEMAKVMEADSRKFGDTIKRAKISLD